MLTFFKFVHKTWAFTLFYSSETNQHLFECIAASIKHQKQTASSQITPKISFLTSSGRKKKKRIETSALALLFLQHISIQIKTLNSLTRRSPGNSFNMKWFLRVSQLLKTSAGFGMINKWWGHGSRPNWTLIVRLLRNAAALLREDGKLRKLAACSNSQTITYIPIKYR